MNKVIPAMLIGSLGLLANSASAELAAVGLSDPINHFPSYLTDTNNLALQICKDGDGTTGVCAFDPLIASNAWSVTTGFGGEAFYNLAQATLNMPNGRRATLGLAAEAAYLNGTPVDGQQFVFGRIRFRVDIPGPGTYRVYHPYLAAPGCQPEVFVVPAGGKRVINETRDIGGGTPFDGILTGEIGPFLKWDPATLPLAPAGYIGDIRTTHTITGSRCGTNFFRIDGPNIGGPGVGTVSTNQFGVSGKIYNATVTPSPLVIDRATFDHTGLTTRLNVFAQASPAATVTLSPVTGIAAATTLTRDAATGNFFTQVSGLANPPTSVTLTAVSPTAGVPNTVVTIPVTDQVDVLPAVYTAATNTLLITARSSEKALPPTLTATVGKTPYAMTRDAVTGDYKVSVTVVTPPVSVTVTSSKGGKDVENIQD